MSWGDNRGDPDVAAALERARTASLGRTSADGAHAGAKEAHAADAASGDVQGFGAAASCGALRDGAEDGPLSVSAAMALAKGALEDVTVRLLGEVSELSNKPGYKAVYFTVKDTGASLPCMMWNNRYRAAGVHLSVGMLVELSGRFTLYAPKGRMNFDVFSVSLAGEGSLRLQVANLARKLEVEGLMNPARKRPLPDFPQTVGLVTSPRGAAVHDVLRTLRRRFPLAAVLVAGVAVEGAGAPSGIVCGMRSVVAKGAEVVLVVRGGGSFEDLMPFNDEGLARAIAACPVPVVTGIGHEPDTSIADMVADVRASTPTAAAEAVSPARENLAALFAARARALHAGVSLRVERERARVERVADRSIFRDPSLLFAVDAQTLDIMADRLSRALPASLERDGARLTEIAGRFWRSMPAALAGERVRLGVLQGRVQRAGTALLQPFAHKLGLSASRMHDLSPLAVLARGYAMARNGEGRVIKSVSQVRVGDAVGIDVSDGKLSCRVEDIAPAQRAAKTRTAAKTEQRTAASMRQGREGSV